MIFTINFYKSAFCVLLLGLVIIVGIFIMVEPPETVGLAMQMDDKNLSTLVIDPGHGGEDGGAVSIGGIPESGINLDIGLKMASLSRLMGYPCVMTRETESIAYPSDAATVSKRKISDQKARIKLIEETENAVLFSVHQNHYPHASPHGPQVFFAKTINSDTLAKIVQASLNTALCPENRRVSTAVASNIYLMKNVSCPAILAECGFLSNPQEAKCLESSDYRLKVALSLISAYLQFTNDESI